MKVKHLLQWTEWRPGSEYDAGKRATLSILLPTFSRGRDGLFLRAARSILSQTLTNLELIIVDDASTDGTARIIADLMVEDGRVSCLTHKINIGLPAISEYEAYLKSRGEFIGFGFDDFLFERHALETMIHAMRQERLDAAFGTVALRIDAHRDFALGKARECDALVFKNFIGNASVILLREVVERVGLYDPHVAATRICDWDLWRRIVRKLTFKPVKVTVGREFGSSRADSLGNTYPMHPESIQEFVDEERDELLIPRNFPERDVLAMPPFASVPLQTHVAATRSFFANKAWYKAPASEANHAKRKVISVFGDLHRNAQFAWGAIPNSPRFHVNWIETNPGTFHQDVSLLRSDAVIFSGSVIYPSNAEALAFCRRHDIPAIYFVDERAPVTEALVDCEEQRPGAGTSAAPVQRLSHFEEVLRGGRLRGWAFEEQGHRSVLEFGVDGRVVARMPAYLERLDLKEAGIGDGRHAFLFDLPLDLMDGGEHEVEVRWASDHAQLQNSPKRVFLPTASEARAARTELSPVDIDSLRSLELFDAIAAGSEELQAALYNILPAKPVLLARPAFSQNQLERQRRIRAQVASRPDSLRIAVLLGPSNEPFERSSLASALRSIGAPCDLRCSGPVSLEIEWTNACDVEGERDFIGQLDDWTEWGADLALVAPTTPMLDRYRSDAEILYCLYIGAPPIVPDTPCFASWDATSGVQRVPNTLEGWGSALKALSDPAERRSSLARLEAACRERFSLGRQEDLLEEMLQNVAPLDFVGFVERYRSSWREMRP
jgi:glycosyltransferase involved in cell wall biosynthesis